MGATKRVYGQFLEYIELQQKLRDIAAANSSVAHGLAELRGELIAYLMTLPTPQLRVVHEEKEYTFTLMVQDNTIRDNTDEDPKATIRTYSLLCE